MECRKYIILILFCIVYTPLLLFSQNSKKLLDSLNYLTAMPSDSVVITSFEKLEKLSTYEQNDSVFSYSLLVLSSFYLKTGDLHNYERVIVKSIDLINNNSNIPIDDVISSLNNASQYFYKKGNTKKSHELLLKAISMNIANSGDMFDSALMLHNLSINYANFGDFESALSNCRRALEYMLKYEPLYEIDKINQGLSIVNYYSTLGRIYSEKKNFKKAKEVLQLGLDVLEKEEFTLNDRVQSEINILQRVVVVHLYLDEMEEASRNLKKCSELNLISEFKIFETHRLQFVYYNKVGNRNLGNKHQDLAIKLALKASSNDKQFAFVPKIHLSKGEIFMELDSLELAIESFNEGMKFFDLELGENLKDNPFFEEILHFPEALSLLQKKSQVAYQIYKRDDDPYYQEVSINAYLATVDLLDQMKESYLVDGSKFYVAEKAYPIYNEAIKVLYEKYEQDNDPETLDQIFKVIEKNKGGILFESVKNKFELLSSTIPDTLIDKESDLKSSISYYKKLVSEEKQKDSPDTLRVLEYENAVFEAEEAFAILNSKLKSDYADYYHYKADLKKSKTIADVQQGLNKDDLLLEYFQTDDALYLLGISYNDAYFEKCEQEGLFELIEEYRQHISQSPKQNALKSNIQEVSQDLAKLILNPMLSKFKGSKNITIIPDGSISQIPFESLIIQSEDGRLDYAIQEYNFNYFFAVEQFLNAKASEKIKNPKILCLAPQFSGPITDSRVCSNSSLGKLPFAKEEMVFLNENFDGKFVGSSETTKADLLDNIEQYPIVHLATHACLNKEDPLLSEIHFTDGYLTNYDIQNLNTRPQLVVLSACNTAQGELRKGEGMISLSRGFFEAGVRSLQSSLWALDDYASSEIVKGMYSNLKSGESKSASLRKAKLKYLETADKLRSHPYYWAGIIPMGNDDPMFSAGFGFGWVAIGVLILLLFGFIIKQGSKLAEQST